MRAKIKRDPSGHMLVCGIGIRDIPSCIPGTQRQATWYKTWQGCIVRCYDKRNLKLFPSYKGCTLDPRWVKASAFKKWFDKHYVEGYHLDKDILVPGNKVYGPDTCCFVPPKINYLLLSCKRARGKYPQGISLYRPTNRLKVCLRRFGEKENLGYFATNELDQAVACYNTAKRDHIIAVAREYFSEGLITAKVKNALVRRARDFCF